MAMFSAAIQILAPGQAVFLHPAPALAHAFGQNHVYLGHRMPHALNIHDLSHAELGKQGMEVCLMYDTLDVGHTDLERVVIMFFVPIGIEPIPQLCGDQSFAVKFQNFDVRRFLYAGIAAHRRI